MFYYLINVLNKLLITLEKNLKLINKTKVVEDNKEKNTYVSK
jgi:hypothetical protein